LIFSGLGFLPISAQAPAPFGVETQGLIVIEKNSLLGVYNQTGLEIDETLRKIIECESNWRWWVKNKKSTAYGLCQMIKSTRERVERELGEINWNDPKEQLLACKWLYETEGTKHWKASRKCWENRD